MPLWLLLSLAAALCVSTYYALTKRVLETQPQSITAALVYAGTGLVLLGFSLVRGLPDLQPELWKAVLATTLVNVLATILSFRALKITDFSLAMPMFSFTPLFLLFTSPLIVNEVPSPMGVSGILLIVFGSYVLASRPGMTLLDPLRSLFTNRGMMLILLVAFLYSITTNFDKLVILQSDTSFGQSIVFLLLSLAFFGIAFFRGERLPPARDFLWIVLGSTAQAGASFLAGMAFTMQIVPYVISVKRLSSFFSVLIGAFFFREKHTGRRLVGALLMVAGASVLSFL